MARTASEGPANFARVNELVAQGSKLSEAFVQVAKEALPAGSEEEVTRKSKSVAANYYRVKKQSAEGGTTPAPKPATPRKPSTASAAVTNGSVVDALGAAQAALTAALTQAKNDASELETLRKFKAGIQSAVGS